MHIILCLLHLCCSILPRCSSVELVVSVPLRMGKKIIAHHTLLPCTGSQAPPPEKKRTVRMEVGEVVWAKAYMCPAWPGLIISHAERGLEEPSPDKVGHCVYVCWLVRGTCVHVSVFHITCMYMPVHVSHVCTCTCLSHV